MCLVVYVVWFVFLQCCVSVFQAANSLDNNVTIR